MICQEHIDVSVKGQRCYGKHDCGAKGRTNAIGALIGSTLVAVGLLGGSVNTDVFTTWVEKILLPNIPEKRVIVMDNASFHKREKMQELLQDAEIVTRFCSLLALSSSLFA